MAASDVVGYFLREWRMAQARKPRPAAAPTAGSADRVLSLVAAEPTFDAAVDAVATTLSVAPGPFGGAGASVAVAVAAADVDAPAVAAAGKGDCPTPGRLIGDGPRPPAGPTSRRSLRRPMRSPMKTGSYFVSTTRSFNGMIPLSVMWIPSGHTSVQHFVMLQ